MDIDSSSSTALQSTVHCCTISGTLFCAIVHWIILICFLHRHVTLQAMNDQAEEVSVEELFRELCVRGRDYVTVKDIKKWDYLQELMKVSEVK